MNKKQKYEYWFKVLFKDYEIEARKVTPEKGIELLGEIVIGRNGVIMASLIKRLAKK